MQKSNLPVVGLQISLWELRINPCGKFRKLDLSGLKMTVFSKCKKVGYVPINHCWSYLFCATILFANNKKIRIAIFFKSAFNALV
ncbi:MAG: hypothetical protein ORN55_08860, partial [Chitinophagaceae bacterium]|nr:hypothetical protein [Chitinophagaceae bacterium]